MGKNIETALIPFSIRKIYTKSVSFQSPGSPSVYLKRVESPGINVHIRLSNHKVDEDQSIYEVNMNISVVAKSAEREMFSVEVQQAGLFEVATDSSEELSMALEAGCPSVLFPYAREAVSSLVSGGGFAQLMLDPVNFADIYRKRRQMRSAADRGSRQEGGVEFVEHPGREEQAAQKRRRAAKDRAEEQTDGDASATPVNKTVH